MKVAEAPKPEEAQKLAEIPKPAETCIGYLGCKGSRAAPAESGKACSFDPFLLVLNFFTHFDSL